jgi:hypothetical protein
MSLATMEVQEPVVKKPRISKKPKDPLAPKKPISSYFAFMNAERAGVREALGGTSNMAEVGKELGRRWGELGPEAKVEYERVSKQDKERYDREMKDYQPSEEFLRKKAEVKAASKEPTGAKEPQVSKEPRPYQPAGCFARTIDGYFAFLLTNWPHFHGTNPAQSPKDIQDKVWQQWVSATTAAPKRPMSSFLLFEGELGKKGKAACVASAANKGNGQEE